MTSYRMSWLLVARRWVTSFYNLVSEAEAFDYDVIQERRIFDLERKLAALSANRRVPTKNAAE